MNRRDLLRAVGTAAAAGLAGCSSIGNEDENTATRSPTGPYSETATATDTPTDGTAPVIDEFTAQYTDTASDIAVYLEGHDDEALATAAITTSRDRIRRTPDDTTVTIDTTMQGRPGKVNDVTAQLADEAGNTVDETVETYVRKYDRDLADTRLDIGVHYIPQAGAMFENGCVADTRGPRADYDDPIPPATTSRHIDQMTGHGIGRVVYSYEGFHDSPERLRTFVDSQLVDQVDVVPEISWNTFGNSDPATWEDEVVPRVTDLLRDTLMSNTTTATYGDRPVVRMGAVGAIALHDTPRQHVMKQWGSYDAFMDDIRSRLTVDGSEPFIYGGMPFANWENAYDHPELEQFAPLLDGVSTWVPGINQHAGETYHWEDVFRTVRNTFQTHHDFVTSNDMEFIPTTFPGEDDRGNTCWGPEGKRHIPRSTDRFQQFLGIAEQYATTDMIDIATWNDWAEGTMIEPGTYRGEEYGTAYLDIIQEFQSG